MKTGKYKYTAWGKEGRANTFIPGKGPPVYADGKTRFEDCTEVIWVIYADTWEEASALYHELQGWEPYDVEG